MSGSWSETLRVLRRWRSSRLPLTLFAPASAAIVLASAVGQRPSWLDVLSRLAVAFAAVALLRLWDDLEDREADMRTHADRVWLGDVAVNLAIAIAAGLAVVALFAPLGFAALYAALLVLYRVRDEPLEAVLLLKYPLLIGLLRGAIDADGAAAMLLIYGAMLLDAGYRATGALACWLATGALMLAAPLPGAAALSVGFAAPLVRPLGGRAGVLAAIVVELLAFHLVTS